jgi:hypothetical protein
MLPVHSAGVNQNYYNTWKLNVEKSKYNPGPAPKSNLLTVTAAGQGVKYVSKGVNAEGKETGQEYTANYDGKDVPLTGSQVSDTTSLKRIDANTVERVDKKGGKVMSTIRRVYSKDGKSMTATVKGTNTKGDPTNNMLVYEKT